MIATFFVRTQIIEQKKPIFQIQLVIQSEIGLKITINEPNIYNQNLHCFILIIFTTGYNLIIKKNIYISELAVWLWPSVKVFEYK